MKQFDMFGDIFKNKATQMGWRLIPITEGVFVVMKPEAGTLSIYVKPRGKDEVLRPKHLKMLDKLAADAEVFIAIDGDPDQMIPYKEFPATTAERGRAPNSEPLTPNTLRAYRIKLNALERQYDYAKASPYSTIEKVEALLHAVTQLRSKIAITESESLRAENERARELREIREHDMAVRKQRELQASSDAFDHLMEVAEKEGIKSKEEKDGTS